MYLKFRKSLGLTQGQQLFFLSAVSLSTKSKLKELLRNEAIVNDISCFDSFAKALEACNKYVKDFCAAGYIISDSHVDEDYTFFILHLGCEVELIEITNRKLNHDICDNYYGEDEAVAVKDSLTDKRKAELFEMMLNDRCDVNGIYETIEYMSYACSREELYQLFDKEDVDRVLEEKEGGE